MSLELVYQEPGTQGGQTVFNNITYADGKWVAVGAVRAVLPGSILDPYYLVASATSLTGTWTLNKFVAPDYQPLTNIAFASGVWVATSQYRILTATDPQGTWTARLTTTNPGLKDNSLAYLDGTWAWLNDDGDLYTASDPTSSWTLSEQFPDDFYSILRIVDGEWVIVYVDLDNSLVKVRTASNPTGTWTERSSFSVGSPTPPTNIGLSPNGYFIATIEEVWSAATLDDEWTRDIVWNGLFAFGVDTATVAYAEDAFVAAAITNADVPKVLANTDLDDTFDAETLLDHPCFVYQAFAPVYHDGEWVIVGARYGSDEVDYDGQLAVIWAGLPDAAAAKDGWGLLL